MGENNYNHVDKKTRLEVEQEELLQLYNQYQPPTEQDLQIQAWTRQRNQFLQSISPSQRPYLPQLQQYIQYQDPTVMNPHLQALYHRHRLSQQQQTLQSMSPYQQQQQLRWQLQQQVAQQIPPDVCPFGQQQQQLGQQLQQQQGAHQKFLMFLYHIKQRPEDNCIAFWRKFVAEYYRINDVWQCDLCGTKSGKGVEATYDVLARLFEIKYASGVVDELLSLEVPREYRDSRGLMVLEYRKMVQTTVYEQCRVVHEGPLRIIFSQDLKILSWEFCTRRHEEFLVRRHIAPKVNQLIEVAQKCQRTILECGSEGVSQQNLQTNRDMVLGARRQLADSMGLQSLTYHGYPKKYVRALQTYEVLKSMKELMDFTYEHKVGPIEGWKRLSEQTEAMRLQRQKMQEMEQQFGNSGAMNRWSAQAQMDGLTGNNNNSYNHHHSSSVQAAAALANNQIMLLRRLNAMNNPYSTGGFLSSPQMQQQQQQQRTMHGNPNTLQQTHLPEDATEIPDNFSGENFSDK